MNVLFERRNLPVKTFCVACWLATCPSWTSSASGAMSTAMKKNTTARIMRGSHLASPDRRLSSIVVSIMASARETGAETLCSRALQHWLAKTWRHGATLVLYFSCLAKGHAGSSPQSSRAAVRPKQRQINMAHNGTKSSTALGHTREYQNDKSDKSIEKLESLSVP